jgi:hypothetical protein
VWPAGAPRVERADGALAPRQRDAFVPIELSEPRADVRQDGNELVRARVAGLARGAGETAAAAETAATDRRCCFLAMKHSLDRPRPFADYGRGEKVSASARHYRTIPLFAKTRLLIFVRSKRFLFERATADAGGAARMSLDIRTRAPVGLLIL